MIVFNAVTQQEGQNEQHFYYLCGLPFFLWQCFTENSEQFNITMTF